MRMEIYNCALSGLSVEFCGDYGIGEDIDEGLYFSLRYYTLSGLTSVIALKGYGNKGMGVTHPYSNINISKALKGHNHTTKGVSPSQGQSPQCSPERAK